MKARIAQSKLLSPVKICIFFTLIAITFKAHAEYYLVYGGSPEPAMVELYGAYPYHHAKHHWNRHHWAARHRNSYDIQVYYFLRPDCCGASYYYAPAIPVEAVPVTREYYRGNVVYMAQPDMYSGSQINTPDYGYDSDQRTGDDVATGMDIDY